MAIWGLPTLSFSVCVGVHVCCFGGSGCSFNLIACEFFGVIWRLPRSMALVACLF